MKHIDSEIEIAIAQLTVIGVIHDAVDCPACAIRVLSRIISTMYAALPREVQEEYTTEDLMEMIKADLSITISAYDDFKNMEKKDEFTYESCSSTKKPH